MHHILDITSDAGTPFRVLAIPASDAGPNAYRAPTGRDHALVEFYDRRHDHEAGLGQFTGGYYDLRTLLGRDGGYASGPIGADGVGLNLAGSVPAWSVDAEACRLIRDWLIELDARGLLS